MSAPSPIPYPPSPSSKDPWTAAMLRGDFEAAWDVCDRVLAERNGLDCTRWPRHQQFIWDGSPLEDRHVLVRCYHGLGDTIQFVRLLPALRARARRVTLWVQPALIALLRDVDGADELLPLHDGAPAIEYDTDIELMELPHALRLSAADLPGPIPYIYVSRAPRPPGRQRRVGLVWRGGDWNPDRTLPANAMHPWASAPDVHWCSLQYPPEQPPFPMENLACRELVELAARMQTLDLVISVDTMNAHLAGALGLPVWTLLPTEYDWRWQRDRSDSPWYPTMRLWRQRAPGEWRELASEVLSALRRQRRV